MTDPARRAWEAALTERLDALESAIGTRDWQLVGLIANAIADGLRGAEPGLLLHHEEDIRRCSAALVRAAWEQAPTRSVAAAVESAFLELLDLCPVLTLTDAIELIPRPPDDLHEMLPAWSRTLGDWGGRWRHNESARGRLQREALRMELGADGLKALARQSDELDVWLAWLDALEAEERHEEALRAASDGARTLYWPRHRLQLRLREGSAAARLGQGEIARRAWREVWRHRLCTAGLCMVWEAAGEHARGLFEEELELAYADERQVANDLQVRIELLLGDAELPLARLQAAEQKGWWSDAQHPATQVLPFLLRVGTHAAELDEALLVSRIWRATDDDGRWRPRPPDPVPPGWSVLMDRVIAAHPTWLTDAIAWRVSAGNQLIELAGAVIDGRARTAYTKVCALIVALVEAGVAANDPLAEAPLQAMRRRFPRHKALLQEIDQLRAHSPLLRAHGADAP